MKWRTLSGVGVWWIWMARTAAMAKEPVDNAEADLLIEVAFISLERIAIELDRLIWRLLKMKKDGPEHADGAMEAHAKRMFGIPIKTEKQWKRLAEKVKRKERRRDMKHWKEHSIHRKVVH
ncbi:hypothetical protein J0A71_07g15100 [Encephalitozoon cuniculi]|nr:hypothetical protein J0A71_07g15100 [Encephalitozoon cuniculi]